MVNEKRDPPHKKANINALFNDPKIVEKGDNYHCLLRGLATQPQEGADQYYDRMVNLFLFLIKSSLIKFKMKINLENSLWICFSMLKIVSQVQPLFCFKTRLDFHIRPYSFSIL